MLPVHIAALALSPHRSSDGSPRAAPTTTTPNIITPLLPTHYQQAQEQSRVQLPGYSATELFSGFFTIDESSGSNTYFMYSTPLSGRKDAPVVVWLNGGPGASSLLGFYDELGPFGIDAELQIVPRNVSWARDCHLIAIDNPLGVGYSHTQSLERMATNQTTVGQDLYEALRQFFELFPDLRANPFVDAESMEEGGAEEDNVGSGGAAAKGSSGRGTKGPKGKGGGEAAGIDATEARASAIFEKANYTSR